MNRRVSFALLAIIGGLASVVLAADATPDQSRIRYDNQCVVIDGHDTFLYSGSFHYFRCPRPLWAERFQKMKDAGLNCVETYIAWNWHEQQPPSGPDDFSKMDMTDLTDWLDMAINRYGFYVILRPGPYICAEWDGGGYPQWLVTKKPATAHEPWLRGDDPTYLDWCKHWYAAAAKATVPFQITHQPAGKPGVILWQIENEYNYAGGFSAAIKLHQLQALAHASRDDGIDVPLITCMTDSPLFRADPYLLQNVIECRNTYPKFDPANELRDLTYLNTYQPEKPRIVTELQGGWFSDVGHELSQDMGYTPQQITHVTLLAWANGFTGTNYYMMFGGTNIGDWGAANKTTTYDYAAPIREWGGVGPRYFAVQAMANFLKEHSPSLVRSDLVAVSTDPASDNLSVYLRQAKDGNRFLFVFNNQQKDRATGSVHVVSKDAGIDGNLAYDLDPYDGKILYLPSGQTDLSKGKWYPETVTPPQRPTNLPAAVNINNARRQIDPGPAADSWRNLPAWASVEDMGIYDRRYVYYRTTLAAVRQSGSVLSALVPGQDSFMAQFNNQPIATKRYGRGVVVAPIPETQGDNQLLVLYENGGRDNGGAGLDARCGLINASVGSETVLPKIFSDWSMKIEQGDPSTQPTTHRDSTWQTVDTHDRANQLHPGQTGEFQSDVEFTELERISGGQTLVFGSITGERTVFFNGQKISPIEGTHYDVSTLLHAGRNTLAVIVTASRRAGGIGGGVELDSNTKPAASTLAWQIAGESAGSAGKWFDSALDDSKWESVTVPQAVPESGDASAAPVNLTWYRLHFDLPAPDPHIWAPWKLHLEANGNGLIYLNGHALGRWWEVGPQNDFYLPECWLNFGPGTTNVIALCLRPTKGEPTIQSASVATYSDFAEAR